MVRRMLEADLQRGNRSGGKIHSKDTWNVWEKKIESYLNYPR